MFSWIQHYLLTSVQAIQHVCCQMFSFSGHPIVDLLYPFCPSSTSLPLWLRLLCSLYLVCFGLVCSFIWFIIFMIFHMCACQFASVLSDCLQLYELPGKNTGVDCHALLQGISLTQRSNPHLLWLLLWQAGFLPLAQPGKPYISYMSAKWKRKQAGFLRLSTTDSIGGISAFLASIHWTE